MAVNNAFKIQVKTLECNCSNVGLSRNANVFEIDFRRVNVPWSPAVAPKFYVICTVFNDLN